MAAHEHLSLVRFERTRDQLEQRTLACPIGAYYGDLLAPFDLEGDVLERIVCATQRRPAIADSGIDYRHIPHFQCGGVRRVCGTPIRC